MRWCAVSDPSRVAGTAAKLRSEFDGARAFPPPAAAGSHTVNLLAIVVAGDPYAFPVGEISGLAHDRKIVFVPSSVPELLGIAGIRGAVVPVYSLASLLGYGGAQEQPRWLVLCGGPQTVGFAFGGFEGNLRVPMAHIYETAAEDATHEHVRHVVRTQGLVRGVIAAAQLVDFVKRRCGSNGGAKEL